MRLLCPSFFLLLIISSISRYIPLALAEQSETLGASTQQQPWQARLSLTPSGALSLHWLSRSTEPETVEISEWGATGIVQRIPALPELSLPMDGVHARHVVFPALRPGGSYVYRLPGDGPAVPFRAPRYDANAVSVQLLADMGTWGTVNDVLRALTRTLEGDLLLHLGDLSYATDAATWDKWAELTSSVLRSRPTLFIPGNWDAKPFAWPSFTHRFYSPLLPSPSLYRYTFTYQRMRFFMLNSYEAYTEGSEQYRWLAEELRQADGKAQRRHQPWVIVCFHSPMYSSSTGHGGGDETFRKAIEPLLLANHVDLCFTGHDHGYERSLPLRDGTPLSGVRGPTFAAPVGAPIHVLVGTGGATHDPWIEPQPAWSYYRELTHGYTRLRSFANDSLLIELVRTNDSIADRFWLKRPVPSTGHDTEPMSEGWLSMVPSAPFLCVLLAGVALPTFVLVKYITGGRYRGDTAFIWQPIRRSSSSFLLQKFSS